MAVQGDVLIVPVVRAGLVHLIAHGLVKVSEFLRVQQHALMQDAVERPACHEVANAIDNSPTVLHSLHDSVAADNHVFQGHHR